MSVFDKHDPFSDNFKGRSIGDFLNIAGVDIKERMIVIEETKNERGYISIENGFNDLLKLHEEDCGCSFFFRARAIIDNFHPQKQSNSGVPDVMDFDGMKIIATRDLQFQSYNKGMDVRNLNLRFAAGILQINDNCPLTFKNCTIVAPRGVVYNGLSCGDDTRNIINFENCKITSPRLTLQWQMQPYVDRQLVEMKKYGILKCFKSDRNFGISHPQKLDPWDLNEVGELLGIRAFIEFFPEIRILYRGESLGEGYLVIKS